MKLKFDSKRYWIQTATELLNSELNNWSLDCGIACVPLRKLAGFRFDSSIQQECFGAVNCWMRNANKPEIKPANLLNYI